MRKLRWRVRFKTIKNRDAIVYIYKEGYTGNEVTDLEAAEGVITTDEASDDELLCPIRTQTGYLRVVDNGDLSGLMPTDNMQHYVELVIAGVVEWCGYMQADTFSEEWGVPPMVTEFPLISGLGVLEGCYLDQTKPMTNIRLDELMKECLEMAKVEYERVFIPMEASVSAEYRRFPFHSIYVSRANFFTLNDTENEGGYMKYDAMTAMDVLAELMKIMGWTMHENGKDICIVAHGITDEPGLPLKYGYIGYGNLGTAMEYESSDVRTMRDMVQLTFDGDGHTRDVLQGRKKMKVTASFNPVGEVAPHLDSNILGKKGVVRYEHKIYNPSATYWYDQRIIYGGGSSQQSCEMRVYTLGKDNQTPTPAEYVAEEAPRLMGGTYSEYEIFKKEELADKRNYNYKGAIIVNLRDEINGGLWTKKNMTDYPLFILRNNRDVRYNSGAFVISNEQIRRLDTDIHPITLTIKFRVGKKFWGGSSWVDSDSTFTIDTDESGKILDTKTLEMPYNGACGYIIPIDIDLSGDVELTGYAPDDRIKVVDRFYIEGLNIIYKAEDLDMGVSNEKSENSYRTSAEGTYRENVNVDLKMASYNNNAAGYGLLSTQYMYIEKLYYLGVGAERPERYLLSKLKRVYGRNIEKLTMGVEATGLRPMDGVAYGGKRYDIAYRKMDWENEHEELTIMDVV